MNSIGIKNGFLLQHLGHFMFPCKYNIARQDTECERETVTFNSSFIEFMLAFLGVDQTECACDDPCPSVGKFVKLYVYRKYVKWHQFTFENARWSYCLIIVFHLQRYKQFSTALFKWIECSFDWSHATNNGFCTRIFWQFSAKEKL